MAMAPRPFEVKEEIFWYLVGIIATDGCLSKDARHIDITSKDRDYLIQIRDAIQSRARATVKHGGFGTIAYHIQLGSRALYTRLQKIGLTPKKSLTLGPLRVSDRYFGDFLRGVIDGDGNIRRWIHPTNKHEQWLLRIYGASKPFLQWLEDMIQQLWSITGRIHINRDPNAGPGYVLKYGKLAAKSILAKCYRPGALALERKRVLALQCVSTTVGWSKSKTVGNLKEWRDWTYNHIYPKEVVSSKHK